MRVSCGTRRGCRATRARQPALRGRDSRNRLSELHLTSHPLALHLISTGAMVHIQSCQLHSSSVKGPMCTSSIVKVPALPSLDLALECPARTVARTHAQPRFTLHVEETGLEGRSQRGQPTAKGSIAYIWRDRFSSSSSAPQSWLDLGYPQTCCHTSFG